MIKDPFPQSAKKAGCWSLLFLHFGGYHGNMAKKRMFMEPDYTYFEADEGGYIGYFAGYVRVLKSCKIP